VLLGFVLLSSSAYSQIRITTMAGGYVGDGKPGPEAALQNPQFAAMDVSGNLYVADYHNHRIRKLTRAGMVGTFAGNGIAGFSGDGGQATAAKIDLPTGIVVDSASNVIFSDTGNNRIRKVNPAGIIGTIAGTGTAGFSGDGGPAILAEINQPHGLALDAAGNLYFSDLNNQRIRKIDAAGNISTVAGNGTAGFAGDGGPATSASINNANGVYADSSGNLYIADTLNLRVRKVDTAGTITTIAGSGLGGCTGDGGPATSARIGELTTVTMHNGNLIISNAGCDLIRQVNLTTNIITTIAGSLTSLGFGGFDGNGHTALASVFLGPTGVLYDHGGNLLIVDSYNDQVRKVDNTTQIVTALFGGYTGDGKAATSSVLNDQGDIEFDSRGNLYIADTLNNRVRKVATSGVITTFAGTGVTGQSGDGGPATSATLSLPLSVAPDASGNVFIADLYGAVIRKVDSSGNITTLVDQSGGLFLTSMVTDSAGDIYGADPYTCVVWKITPAGAISVVAGVPFVCFYNSDGIPATSAYLSSPSGVDLDTNGNLYIADSVNSRVRRVDAAGIISTYAGDGSCGYGGDGGPATSAQLCNDTGVGVDSAGNVYIADYGNLRVRRVNAGGTISTLAGTGSAGYNGNNLPATQTDLDAPIAVRVGPSRVVYVADAGQARVRKIH
jgi:sugar lactone lactonase YvrE